MGDISHELRKLLKLIHFMSLTAIKQLSIEKASTSIKQQFVKTKRMHAGISVDIGDKFSFNEYRFSEQLGKVMKVPLQISVQVLC